MSLEPGQKLGPYEILVALGAGGMGEVYRARDTRLDRDVAIKVLPAHLTADDTARQRLEREAKAVSALSHPNICTLYDVGHDGDVDYLVIEYLEGETLAQRLAREPLATHEMLDCAIQIADALDKAHRGGVIHRDLKPGNIMLTPQGAKLLDFGLAKSMAGPGEASNLTVAPTANSPLTMQGAIVGTFQYMAPEQLEGQEADVRSDIFAFGSVLFEMITGRCAFEGKTQAGLIAAIIEREPPDVSTLQPLASPALDRLVRTCLAKDPSQRDRLGTILYTCAQAVRIILEFLAPIMPDVARSGLERAGGAAIVAGGLIERTAWGALPAGTCIRKSEPLIPRKT